MHSKKCLVGNNPVCVIFSGSKRMNLVLDCFDPTFWVVVLTQLLFKNDYSAWSKIIACRIIIVTTQETGKNKSNSKNKMCVSEKK